MNGTQIISLCALLALAGCELPPAKSYSSATYSEVNRAVGCLSNLGDGEKRRKFNDIYKDHIFVWPGFIVTLSDSDASISLDGRGTQDLVVYLADKKGGIGYRKKQKVAMVFQMISMDGCFLPFYGINAILRAE